MKPKYTAFAMTVLMTASMSFGITSVSGLDSGFSDLSPSHPNYKAIMELKNRGVIQGYPDGTFKPDQPVNRVEALKIILLGSKIDVSQTQTVATYKDIQQNMWYSPYLNKATELKIVEGYPDKTFKPTQTVNLVENLKMLINSNGIDPSTIQVTTDPYKDAYAKEWYAKYVQYAKDKTLIDADTQGNVYPAQGMTRAKLSEAMYRLMMVKEGQTTTTQTPVATPTQQTISTQQQVPPQTQQSTTQQSANTSGTTQQATGSTQQPTSGTQQTSATSPLAAGTGTGTAGTGTSTNIGTAGTGTGATTTPITAGPTGSGTGTTSTTAGTTTASTTPSGTSVATTGTPSTGSTTTTTNSTGTGTTSTTGTTVPASSSITQLPLVNYNPSYTILPMPTGSTYYNSPLYASAPMYTSQYAMVSPTQTTQPLIYVFVTDPAYASYIQNLFMYGVR